MMNRLFLIILMSLAYLEGLAQATTISPWVNSSELPNSYPQGVYIMGTESDAPYSWRYDAGVLIGIKPSPNSVQSRHIQLITDAHGNRVSIRSKNASNNSWNAWKNFVLTNSSGNVGIGLASPTHKLEVNGTIRAKEVKLEASNWPDYVFEEGYPIKSLEEVEAFIRQNHHLPDIPSEKEVLENGIELGKMDAKLLQKIEELTLYTIGQEKKINDLKSEIQELKQLIKEKL